MEATAGMEYEQMEEDRLGYINNLGKQGALKRDETGSVSSTGVFAQGQLDAQRALERGGRCAQQPGEFGVDDRFIAKATQTTAVA